MNITKLSKGDNLLISVEGRLDTITHLDFEKELDAILSGGDMNGIAALTLDFSNLEYISSAGLRSLLKLQKDLNSRNISFAISNPNDLVTDVLSITGIDQVIKVDT